MRKRFIVGICCIIVIVGAIVLAYCFLIGDIKPDSSEITPYQKRHLTITFISAIVTSLALAVALLKDEIRSLWQFAQLEVSNPVLTEDLEKVSNSVIAKQYELNIIVKNTGRIPARECSLVLTGLEYVIGQGETTAIDVSSVQELIWKGKSDGKTIIPSHNGTVAVNILQIVKNSSSTANSAQSAAPTLFISGINANKEITVQEGSKWIATFMLYSETCSHVCYKIEILWNGEWHDRLTEMKAKTKRLTSK